MDSKMNVDLVSKAVKELVKYSNRQQSSKAATTLIEDNATPISVQIQLIHEPTKVVIRPIRVKIPHSMFSAEEEGHSVCLFCRSEDKDRLVSHFKSSPFEGLTSVISLGEVNKQFKAFKDKKEILSNHTHFVCDVAIVSHLYNLLGKVFGQRNNYPVPITVSDGKGDISGINSNIQQVVDSTYMALKSQHINVRFGHTGMPLAHVVENITQGVAFAVENKIKDGWKNVHSLHIKTPTSASLPLYYRNNQEIMNLLAASATQSVVPLPVPSPAPAPASTPAAAKSKPAASAVKSAAKTKAAAVAEPTPAAAPKPKATPAAVASTPAPAAKSAVKGKASKVAATPTLPADVWPPAPPAPVHSTAKAAAKPTSGHLLKPTASSAAKVGKAAAATATTPAASSSSTAGKKRRVAEVQVDDEAEAEGEEIEKIASPALTRARKAAKAASAASASSSSVTAPTKASAAKTAAAKAKTSEPAGKKQKKK